MLNINSDLFHSFDFQYIVVQNTKMNKFNFLEWTQVSLSALQNN